MKLLSREEILAASDVTTETVNVPEWGGAVLVKALSGAERDRFEASVAERKGKKTRLNMTNVRARLAALAIVDEAGKPLFRPGDVEALGQKSAAGLNRVFDVAMRLAGMRDADLEELTENFPPDQSEGSISA
jgi:hypothetical protein